MLAPLLKSSESRILGHRIPVKRAGQPRRAKKPKRRRVKAARSVTKPTPGRPPGADGPRQRAARALAANPNASLTAVAKIAGVSRSTVANARGEIAKEARKEARREARKQASKSLKPETIEHRARAQRFLKDTLAGGPKRASDVEEAADRAHIDAPALAATRTELGVVTSRGNAGGVMAVQWSLPG